MSIRSSLAFGACLALIVSSSGCFPEEPATPPATSIATEAEWAAAVGCYNFADRYDFYFSGIKNSIGNAAYIEPRGGTCSRRHIAYPTNSIVEAPDQATANAICDGLEPEFVHEAVVLTNRPDVTPTFTVPNTWLCVS